jgi:hypothetical protein
VESLEMLAAVLHPEYQSPPDVSGRAIRLDAVTLGLL